MSRRRNGRQFWRNPVMYGINSNTNSSIYMPYYCGITVECKKLFPRFYHIPADIFQGSLGVCYLLIRGSHWCCICNCLALQCDIFWVFSTVESNVIATCYCRSQWGEIKSHFRAGKLFHITYYSEMFIKMHEIPLDLVWAQLLFTERKRRVWHVTSLTCKKEISAARISVCCLFLQ